MLTKFREYFAPTGERTPVSAGTLESYAKKVPETLSDLWQADGFGKYNDGLIELVNPADFEPSLKTWLGRPRPTYVPFAITGFGELFYYRKLTPTNEDVCLVDLQYRKIETVIWSMEGFFESFLANPEDRKVWLREPLFQQAIAELGPLDPQEVFTFAPILAMGGGQEVQYLKKGNAQVYQELVFQMTS